VTAVLGPRAFAQDQVVVFTANWCASCREVVPVVREVVQQNGLPAVVIDVDSQYAPREASRYGLSVPTEAPPQVFLVRESRIIRLYNGEQYRFGGREQV